MEMEDAGVNWDKEHNTGSPWEAGTVLFLFQYERRLGRQRYAIAELKRE
jgi:hypothetical protein